MLRKKLLEKNRKVSIMNYKVSWYFFFYKLWILRFAIFPSLPFLFPYSGFLRLRLPHFQKTFHTSCFHISEVILESGQNLLLGILADYKFWNFTNREKFIEWRLNNTFESVPFFLTRICKMHHHITENSTYMHIQRALILLFQIH